MFGHMTKHILCVCAPICAAMSQTSECFIQSHSPLKLLSLIHQHRSIQLRTQYIYFQHYDFINMTIRMLALICLIVLPKYVLFDTSSENKV